jgi:hypothetical protein
MDLAIECKEKCVYILANESYESWETHEFRKDIEENAKNCLEKSNTKKVLVDSDCDSCVVKPKEK